MRSEGKWHAPITEEVARHWPDNLGDVPVARLAEVELGLYLMERVVPGEPAIAGWTLLGGYPFARAFGYGQTAEHQQLLRVARHYLWSMRRRRQWQRALEAYRQVPDHLRGYQLATEDQPATRRAVTVAATRWATYEQALRKAPPFARKDLKVAGAGQHRFVTGRHQHRESVRIPDTLPFARPPGHDLDREPAGGGKPVTFTLEELRRTAEWMDTKLAGRDDARPSNWQGRLARVELHIRDGAGFTASDTMTIDQLLHIVGMVGAGKSTLRDVVAVTAAQRGLRTTLVVGDVAETLTLVRLFNDLGLRTAPVLGASTRERHITRLHRRLATAGNPTLLTHTDPGFAYLSTACIVDGLRGLDADEPLRFRDAPCTGLQPVQRSARPLPGLPPQAPVHAAEDEQVSDSRQAQRMCPLWSACPRHHGARELVDADIWVATPASLVHSAVPKQLNVEQVRYLELACRRSDLIIVDEADRVQMQLDSMFSPATTLVGRSPDSWLDEVHAHKIAELARSGRLQLSDHDVEVWTAAMNTVSSAADRLYAMLMQLPDVREWVLADYFSAWTLQEQLLEAWYPTPREPDAAAWNSEQDPQERDEHAASRAVVRALLDTFHDDPLGDRPRAQGHDADELVRLTLDLLQTARIGEARERVRAQVQTLSRIPAEDASRLDQAALQFEFTLLLTALHHRLDLMTSLWPRVEAALNLDSTSNQMSRRPPADYSPLIPESPMGNVLGFQFRLDDERRGGGQSGELTFFRCAGVGRELLLSLHQLTAADARPGPHVVLLSGTSWAGTSTRYHIHADVDVILKPPAEEIAAIHRSVFRTEFLRDADGTALRLSGQAPQNRAAVLEQMLTQLARPQIPGDPSPLALELAEIPDPERRRALLLVGSYDEAHRAADILDAIPEWTGRVCRLVSDDADLDHLWQLPAAAGKGKILRRGDVSTFGDTGAQLLVAPLLAVERGHNILNGVGQAAIGSAYFLVRPHPRPDDLTLAVQAINDWAVRATHGDAFTRDAKVAGGLDDAGRQFRRRARAQWRRLITRKVAWSSLPADEKASFTWDQMVVIWQVIGRLVRGGVPARVHFVDAAFAPREAGLSGMDTDQTSLLRSMYAVLQPYFRDDSAEPPLDQALVRTLYGPLHQALSRMS